MTAEFVWRYPLPLVAMARRAAGLAPASAGPQVSRDAATPSTD